MLVRFAPPTDGPDDESELVTGSHPLVRMAVEYYRGHRDLIHPVSAISVETDQLPGGTFLYGVFAVRITVGSRERRRLEAAFLNVGSGEALGADESSRLLGVLLGTGEPWKAAPSFAPDEAREALEELHEVFEDRLALDRRAFLDRSEQLRQARLASLTSAHSVRVDKKRELLGRAREKGSAPQYIRMLEGQIRNMEAAFHDRRQDIEGESRVEYRSELCGCGIVRVG